MSDRAAVVAALLVAAAAALAPPVPWPAALLLVVVAAGLRRPPLLVARPGAPGRCSGEPAARRTRRPVAGTDRGCRGAGRRPTVTAVRCAGRAAVPGAPLPGPGADRDGRAAARRRHRRPRRGLGTPVRARGCTHRLGPLPTSGRPSVGGLPGAWSAARAVVRRGQLAAPHPGCGRSVVRPGPAPAVPGHGDGRRPRAVGAAPVPLPCRGPQPPDGRVRAERRVRDRSGHAGPRPARDVGRARWPRWACWSRSCWSPGRTRRSCAPA